MNVNFRLLNAEYFVGVVTKKIHPFNDYWENLVYSKANIWKRYTGFRVFVSEDH